MEFYATGNKNNPAIFLIPGTCCHYSLFDQVIPLLSKKLYCVVVSFDGFDENENTTYVSMEDETVKIEKYVKDNFNNHIRAIYGCSLGGSFATYLVQRGNINVDHIIIGSSDFDDANKLVATIEGKIITPIMYKMINEGKLPKFMQKKMDKMKIEDPKRYEQQSAFLNTFLNPALKGKVSKESIYNQFVSDLTTHLKDNIQKEGTTIHVFYALQMGSKYRERYLKHLHNPDIREQDMTHESFFFTCPKEWSEEVFDCVL